MFSDSNLGKKENNENNFSVKANNRKEINFVDNIPEIINLKGKKYLYGKKCEKIKDIVYCGRSMFMGNWELEKSIWGNPFKVTNEITNEMACKKYEEYLLNNSELMDKLYLLKGKKLACWCSPLPCHTEIIIKIMKQKNII